MRRIGEEVPEEFGPKDSGKLLKEYRISTTSYHIIMSRMKVLGMGFGVAFLFLTIFLIGPMMMIDPMEIFGIFGLIMIVTFLLFSLMLGLMFAIMVPIARSILKGNKIFLTDDGILVKHQYWISTAKLTNLIPYEKISEIRKADEEYFQQTRDAVPVWKRLLLLGVPPPTGGLYHIYSNHEGLLILFLDRPLRIKNMMFNKMSTGVPMFEEKVVKEVIIDIHPEEQEEFMSEVRKRSGRELRPKLARAPPG
jgi:hypothetical protein